MKLRKKYKNETLSMHIVRLLFLCIGIGVGALAMYVYLSNRPTHMGAISEISGLVTDKIAIVNLDQGVITKEEEIHYASRLLAELPDNFIFTGLEDARGGYSSGIYAGYMVIPATFSESIVSLNSDPVRAEISYAINGELEEAVKEKVIYDVIGLVSELNNKVSYMYLHSVLDEFHDAQDQSDVVMANDLEEKEAINAVQAEDLVALVPVTEMTEVEYNIETVDISEYMSRNMELTGQVGTKYMEYLMASEEDHQKINLEAMDLLNEMSNMDSIILGADLAQDGEGNLVYQNGAEELETLFEEHGTILEEKKTELNEHVIQIYEDIQHYFTEYDRVKEAYTEEYEQEYLNTLTALENLFEEYQANYILVSSEELQQIYDVVEQQNEQIVTQQEIISDLQSQPMMADSEDGEAVEEDYQEVQVYNAVEIPDFQVPSIPEMGNEELSELQLKMQEVLKANYYLFSDYQLDEDGNAIMDEDGNYIELRGILAEYTQDLSDPKIKAEILEKQVGDIEPMDIMQVTQIVDESILMPIQENVDTFTTAVMDQYAIEKEQLGEYDEAIMKYNPLEYIDHEEIQGLTEQMFDNGTKLSEAILETDMQQMEYVSDVYDATRNDLSSLQESIVQAKEDSDKAVEEGLSALKDVKNNNSAENQAILYDFSRKLPYTRLGSLEYRQAYEFMVNPLEYEQIDNNGNGRTSQDSVKKESDSINVQLEKEQDFNNIALLITSMICVIIVGITIKYHFHKKEDMYEF